MKLLLATILLFGITQVQAGPSTSGGGGAFVCRNSQGQVTSSELLDLWEAKNLLKWNVIYGKMSVQKHINNALARLAEIDTELASVVETELIKIRKEASYLPASIALPAPDDANHLYMKPGCPLEGMLYYDSQRAPEPGLVVDTAIFNKLQSSTDTAAAWVHEAVYKVYRDKFKAINSVNARKVTACLFSTDFPCLEAHPKGLVTTQAPGTNAFLCESKTEKISFKAYQAESINMSASWVLGITQLGNQFFSKPIYSRSLAAHEVSDDPRPLDTILFSYNLKSGLSWSGYYYNGMVPKVKLRKIDNMSNPTKITVVITQWNMAGYQGEGDTVYESYRTIPCKLIQ